MDKNTIDAIMQMLMQKDVITTEEYDKYIDASERCWLKANYSEVIEVIKNIGK